MNDWKQTMADILTSGRPPTNDELEEALAGAMTERNGMQQELTRVAAERDQFQGVIKDMSAWLGRLTAAFIRGDAGKLAETMAAFVEERVRPATSITADKQSGTVH